MTVKLLFGHADNESATAEMAFGDSKPIAFDYVKLVKHLFDHPEDDLSAEADDSYTDAQKARLSELVGKIESTARGGVTVELASS